MRTLRGQTRARRGVERGVKPALLPWLATFVLVGCVARPTVKSEAYGKHAPPREPACAFEVLTSGVGLQNVELVGNVETVGDEPRTPDDPALIALVRPRVCRLGGEVVVGTARSWSDGVMLKTTVDYSVLRRTPAKPAASPSPPVVVTSAPIAPALPPIGVTGGAADITIRAVHALPGTTQIVLDVGSAADTLALVANESHLDALTDEHGVSLLSPDASVETYFDPAARDRVLVSLSTKRTLSRDSHRLVAYATVVLEVVDDVTSLHATLAPRADRVIATKIGGIHVLRSDGMMSSSPLDDLPPKKATTITLADLDDRDHLVRLDARIDGKPAPQIGTAMSSVMSSGVLHVTRRLHYAPSARPIDIELTTITPRRDTSHVAVVAAVPE